MKIGPFEVQLLDPETLEVKTDAPITIGGPGRGHLHIHRFTEGDPSKNDDI